MQHAVICTNIHYRLPIRIGLNKTAIVFVHAGTIRWCANILRARIHNITQRA